MVGLQPRGSRDAPADEALSPRLARAGKHLGRGCVRSLFALSRPTRKRMDCQEAMRIAPSRQGRERRHVVSILSVPAMRDTSQKRILFRGTGAGWLNIFFQFFFLNMLNNQLSVRLLSRCQQVLTIIGDMTTI